MLESELGQLPPQAPELEQAILGALMIESEPILHVSDLLKPEQLYVEAHQHIYRAILTLYNASKPVDVLTVTRQLRSDGTLDIVGGAFYVARLTNVVVSAGHVLEHTALVVQKFMLREVIRIANESSRKAYDETTDAFELLDELAIEHTDLHNIVTPRETTAAENIGALVDKNPERDQFLTFGIDALDAECVVEKGLVYTMAGRPGMGKSVVSTHIAWHLTNFGTPILFSPEMNVRQVQARILSMESGVPYRNILQRRMTEEELSIVSRTIHLLAPRLARLKIDPTSGITPLAIRARCERAMKMGAMPAFLVDYVQIMGSGDKEIDRDDRKRVSACSRGITETAKALKIPAFVFSQLNRDVEKRPDKKPKMSDLRDSGSLEQDAAFIGLLYRPGYYDDEQPLEGELEINIAKYRDGAVGRKQTMINIALNRVGDIVTSPPVPPPAPEYDINPDKVHAPERNDPDDLPF